MPRCAARKIFGPCCHIAPFDTRRGSDRGGQRQRLRSGYDHLDAPTWPAPTASPARIEVGLCWVNSWFLRDLRTPFGGAKQSGIGREGGVHSLEFYTELKNVCIKL